MVKKLFVCFRTIAGSWNVRVGSSQHASGGTSYKVSRVVTNPQFNAIKLDYDIAVLILSEAIAIDGLNTKTISLPTLNQNVPAGSNAFVTGWGSTNVIFILIYIIIFVSHGYI